MAKMRLHPVARDYIRDAYSSGKSTVIELAKEFDVSIPRIYQIVAGLSGKRHDAAYREQLAIVARLTGKPVITKPPTN